MKSVYEHFVENLTEGVEEAKDKWEKRLKRQIKVGFIPTCLCVNYCVQFDPHDLSVRISLVLFTRHLEVL